VLRSCAQACGRAARHRHTYTYTHIGAGTGTGVACLYGSSRVAQEGSLRLLTNLELHWGHLQPARGARNREELGRFESSHAVRPQVASCRGRYRCRQLQTAGRGTAEHTQHAIMPLMRIPPYLCQPSKAQNRRHSGRVDEQRAQHKEGGPQPHLHGMRRKSLEMGRLWGDRKVGRRGRDKGMWWVEPWRQVGARWRSETEGGGQAAAQHASVLSYLAHPAPTMLALCSPGQPRAGFGSLRRPRP